MWEKAPGSSPSPVIPAPLSYNERAHNRRAADWGTYHPEPACTKQRQSAEGPLPSRSTLSSYGVLREAQRGAHPPDQTSSSQLKPTMQIQSFDSQNKAWSIHSFPTPQRDPPFLFLGHSELSSRKFSRIGLTASGFSKWVRWPPSVKGWNSTSGILS